MSNNQNMNISRQNIKGTCDLKCAYNFKYQESNSTATNNSSFISLSYDNGSVSPVLFNNQKYNVSTINIVSPSIHKFNNKQAAAEIYIEHTSVSGGPLLLVCIPIVSSTSSSNGSELLTQIIQSVSNNAPSDGDTTNLNISDFTLDNIIPNKPFYNYNDYENNSWVVFDISNAIQLSNSVLQNLNKIISSFSMETQGKDLYYNSKGPNSSGNGVGEGIYISCQPTGSSEEETNVSLQKNQTSYDLNQLFSLNNPLTMIIINILIGLFVCVLVYLFINYGFHYITDKKSSGTTNVIT